MEETLEISEKLLWELGFLWIAFLMGFFVRAVFDVLIIFRRFVRHGAVWTGLEDFIYCVCAAIGDFILFYEVNYGAPRGFALVAMAAGFLLYHLGLSPIVCFAVGKIMLFLTWPVRKTANFLKKLVKRC